MSEYNRQKLYRPSTSKRGSGKADHESEPALVKRVKTRDPVSSIKLGALKCFLCLTEKTEKLIEGGTYHATSEKLDPDHLIRFTDNMKKVSLKLNDMRVFSLFTTGDAGANELWYH